MMNKTEKKKKISRKVYMQLHTKKIFWLSSFASLNVSSPPVKSGLLRQEARTERNAASAKALARRLPTRNKVSLQLWRSAVKTQ
ncbi:hypothetical protein Ocin01_01571 [Orchesella cincta]|uniref:Uncharacterized protein n=1 Tax=Orchesella cincta TaxID=48709 RepID=A0A1D2NIZ1_ORCCI|nr:hypothetical protein Ocin01_01571 [Orchesella cincta]